MNLLKQNWTKNITKPILFKNKPRPLSHTRGSRVDATQKRSRSSSTTRRYVVSPASPTFLEQIDKINKSRRRRIRSSPRTAAAAISLSPGTAAAASSSIPLTAAAASSSIPLSPRAQKNRLVYEVVDAQHLFGHYGNRQFSTTHEELQQMSDSDLQLEKDKLLEQYHCMSEFMHELTELHNKNRQLNLDLFRVPLAEFIPDPEKPVKQQYAAKLKSIIKKYLSNNPPYTIGFNDYLTTLEAYIKQYKETKPKKAKTIKTKP